VIEVGLAELVVMAERAAERAYAPYSTYRVGAAVRGQSGRVYTGCNVENASYGATLCAERVAVATMVAAGETRLSAAAVFTFGPEPAMPCGICRQTLREFAEHADVVAACPSGTRVLALSALLPDPFVLAR
jgi:cytidine deaminase